MSNLTVNKEELVGTWRLVSWENLDEDGSVNHPLGSDAKGYISYTDDGHVFVHIMAGNRKEFSTDGLFDVTPDECVQAYTTHISYCGPYEIDGQVIVHKVDVCSYPNWVGSIQRRHAEFKDGRLLLSAKGVPVETGKVDAYLEWEPFAR